MDSEALIESNVPTQPEDEAPKGGSGGWWKVVAVAAVIAAAFAGRSAGIAMADRNWENLLVGTRLADPDVAVRVRAECWNKRDEFRTAAEANRKAWEAGKSLRNEGTRMLNQPQPAPAPAPVPAPATRNPEPKREAP